MKFGVWHIINTKETRTRIYIKIVHTCSWVFSVPSRLFCSDWVVASESDSAVNTYTSLLKNYSLRKAALKNR